VIISATTYRPCLRLCDCQFNIGCGGGVSGVGLSGRLHHGCDINIDTEITGRSDCGDNDKLDAIVMTSLHCRPATPSLCE